MTLDDAPAGTPVVIGRPEAEPDRCLRMAQVGLRPGAHVVPLHRTVGGGRIIGVGDARVAVGRAVLRSVPVIDPDHHTPAGPALGVAAEVGAAC
jgi:ferrous iron transport protein A